MRADRCCAVSQRGALVYGLGNYELADPDGDNNDDVVWTTSPAGSCLIGDLQAVSVVNGGTQTIQGIDPGGWFEFVATYSNSAQSQADGATIQATMSWPVEGTIVADTPVCQPSGGATCPTSWTLSNTQWQGTGVVMPPGSSLVITYTGTAGPDNQVLCRPRYSTFATAIIPPQSFTDTNYSPYWWSNPTMGNNRTSVTTQTNVGLPCGTSYDASTTVSGPYTDPAATTLATLPLAPGQVVLFKNVLGNNASSYTLDDGWVGTFATSSQLLQRGGLTGPGIPWKTAPNGQGSAYDGLSSGVQCGGALGNGSDPLCAPFLYTNDTSEWTFEAGVGEYPLHNGGSVSYVSRYVVPGIGPDYAESGCLPPDRAPGGRVSLTVSSSITATVIPSQLDRNLSNNNAWLQLPVEVPVCGGNLAVTKTALTATVPADHVVRYQIVATNPSTVDLDLPRIRDAFQTVAPATITCTGTTGGALCPSFAVNQGTKYLAGGSSEPLTSTSTVPCQYGDQCPVQFDFVWGVKGAPTMPAGSTVTFEVAVSYPPAIEYIVAMFGAYLYNSVTFLADPSSTATWTQASDAATVYSGPGHPFAITKVVSPTRPRPGEVVTFTVDVVNPSVTVSNAHLLDSMNQLLAPTNPNGFSNLQCRPLTAADGVLRTPPAIGSTPCPTFVSDANGIRTTIDSFAGNSGFRMTYTAVAPLTATSAQNVVLLTNDDVYATVGDAASWANLLVQTTSLSGTVWHDANGSAHGTFDTIRDGAEVGTATTGLTAVLIDQGTGLVYATVPVAADGTYEFLNLPVGMTAVVQITDTTRAPLVGALPGSPILPPDWLNTTPLVQLPRLTTTTPITDVDFGVQQPPDTDDKVRPVQPNPGGSVQVLVPPLTGSDPEDGAKGTGSTFQIVTLPTTGTLYYDGVKVVPGQVIHDYDPTKLTVDPNAGAVVVQFTVAVMDLAGVFDTTPATVTMPFSVPDAASISGHVWFDTDNDGLMDASELGIPGVRIVLTGTDDAGNAVSLTTTTDASGAWIFDNLAPGVYRLHEDQPASFADGTDVLGTGASRAGTLGNDEVVEIELLGGDVAVDYNFGEIALPVVPPAVTPLPLTGSATPVPLATLVGLLLIAVGALVVTFVRRPPRRRTSH